MTAARTIRECEADAEIVVISEDDHVHSRCMLHKYLSHERDEDTLNFTDPDFLRAGTLRGQGMQCGENCTECKTLYLGSGGRYPMTAC